MPVTWNPDAVTAAVRRGALRGVVMAANVVRNEVLFQILQTPKSGVTYTRRGVVHQASAPGEAPASDQGTLVREIRVEVDEPRLAARVNSGAAHSDDLEFGTVNMEPRPYMRRSLLARQNEIEAIIAREIQAELR